MSDSVSTSSIPIGFDISTKDIYSYNFTKTKFNIVLSNKLQQNFPFIMALVKILKQSNINLKIVDFLDAFEGDFEGIKVIKDNYDNEFALINNEIANENNSELQNFYLILGMSEYKNKMSQTGQQIVNNLFMASSTFKKSYFIFADDYANYKSLQLESWYQSQVDSSNGIWLGNEVGSQMSININNLSIEDKKTDFPFMAFVVDKGEHTIIKYVVNAGDQDEK